MTVESATYPSELDPTKPTGTDGIFEGDNHLRLLKTVIQNGFPFLDTAFNGVKTVSTLSEPTLDGTYNCNFLVVTGDDGTVRLPNPASLWSGWWCYMHSGGTNCTVEPVAGTINGAASDILDQKQGLLVVCDGANYYSILGFNQLSEFVSDFMTSADPATGRTYLDLGDAATKFVGTDPGQVIVLDSKGAPGFEGVINTGLIWTGETEGLIPIIGPGDKLPASIIPESGVFSQMYESPAQTITNGGSVTVAHGLGVRPKFVVLEITCTTADFSYSPGDVLEFGTSGFTEGNTGGYSTLKDATNVQVSLHSSGAFRVIGKGGGNSNFITPSSWTLVVRAFA